jgi:SAM-dependent methyltransferase
VPPAGGTAARWNHNIHYHRVVLDAAPPLPSRALDVGCGNGLLTVELAGVADEVVGIDTDAGVVERAREEFPALRDAFVVGDLLDHPFEPASFDLVASVATLHHLDAAAGLARMAELLRPGGTLVVVGLARVDRPADLAHSLLAAADNRPYMLLTRRRYWEHSAPIVWPPPESYTSMQALTRELLPGARFRRRLFWRYSIVWTKPTAG